MTQVISFPTAVRIAVAALLLSTSGALFADDAPADEDAEQRLVERWYAVYDDIHKALDVSIDDGVDASISLKSTMVLTLYNPVDTDVRHGRVYVWSRNGRPAVVNCLWSNGDDRLHDARNVCYEFHSLSQQPVMVEKNGNRLWRCEGPGVEWLNHKGTEVPASSRAARLIEMRQIARSYQAGPHRLLTQPIYRYPEEIPGVIDGALFTYVQSNDPQVFLMIEARDDQWSVAFARSQILPRQVTYQEEVVWAVERTRGNWNRIIRTDSQPFFIHFAREQRRADNPEVILPGGLR